MVDFSLKILDRKATQFLFSEQLNNYEGDFSGENNKWSLK